MKKTLVSYRLSDSTRDLIQEALDMQRQLDHAEGQEWMAYRRRRQAFKEALTGLIQHQESRFIMTVRELAAALLTVPEEYQDMEVMHDEEGIPRWINGAELDYDEDKKPFVMLTGSPGLLGNKKLC